MEMKGLIVKGKGGFVQTFEYSDVAEVVRHVRLRWLGHLEH